VQIPAPAHLPGRGSFSIWITSIVVNQSLQHLRQQRHVSLEQAIRKETPLYFTSREPTPEQSTARQEISARISHALAKLSNNLRMPYILHAVSGLPVAEVANKLGRSVSNQITDLSCAFSPAMDPNRCRASMRELRPEGVNAWGGRTFSRCFES
jgi:RNA polymerase sigma factor (sigma-70 family)